jgi:hypothetical protein
MRPTRGVLALLMGVAGLGAAAYAAAQQGPTEDQRPHQRGRGAGGSPPRPRITTHPDELAASSAARFGFSARGARSRFQCRLDDRPWSACRPPVTYRKLAAGDHEFSVRSVGPSGRRSRPASFGWQVLAPKGFSISAQLGGLRQLYPGAPAQSLPLTISNPNPLPIFLTSLSVRVAADPPGCSSAENLVLTGAGVSTADPLKVPPRGSVTLPTPGAAAPTIQMRDLPLNQDACQNARFPLSFSGRARG